MKNELIQMGNLDGEKWERMFEESRRFYDPEGISPTIPTNAGGHHEVKIGEMKQQVRIAASRGRNPENPSCRERESRIFPNVWNLARTA